MPTFRTPAYYTLCYSDAGHGPAVLFFHPFPLDRHAWDAQVAALVPEHRVLAVDFPGFGESGPPPAGLTLASVAANVSRLARGLGLERLSVVGLSMGGYLALELAAQDTPLVERLVLADTRAGADSAEGAAGRERFAKRAEKEGIGWIADDMLPKLLRRRPDIQVSRRVAAAIALATPAGVAGAQRAMAARADHRGTLETLRMPALVITGTEDALISPEESVHMAELLPQGRLHAIPGAGHLSELEEPEAFNRALVSFLTE
ncbi:MAG TPA: alpha/beta hydrolase [Myxococcales bacterium]|nr:alpha/beta hydrolase [Myxococcales bacterium]